MTCTDQLRRGKLRASGHNGIDGVEVSDCRRELTVLLFGKAPEQLCPANFRIEGGRRITDVEVVELRLCAEEDPELEDRVVLTVNHPGDLSTYRLCVVAVDPGGKPGTKPYPGFDPRYACVEFTFHPECAVVDCAEPPVRPVETVRPPEIDYLAKDYASFRQLLLDRLTLTMPAWTERHVPDIGVALVELLAYEGDRLSYKQDAVATEAYLDTARLRTSIRRHARLVDYAMHEGCAARAWVCLEVTGDVALTAGDFRFTTLRSEPPVLRESDLGRRGLPPYEVFEPVQRETVQLHRAHNLIHLWTWGDTDCCLPIGSTAATLVDKDLRLRPGDVLVFEESGDFTHRQAVRLVTVTKTVDELYEQPVLEVTWAREDALTFPLRINTCEQEVGVARGNVVLVEHGRSVLDKPIDPNQLPDSPITHSVPFPAPAEVAAAQADRLLGLPDRVRDGLTRLWHRLCDQEPTEQDRNWLITLFGRSVLRKAGFDEHPRHAVRGLLARFDRLLAAKLDRLAEIIRRTRSGYVLTADGDAWEIGQSWGAEEGAGIDPDLPVFRGPAVQAIATDPRTALPAVRITDRYGEVWEPRRDLLDSAPFDRHFVGECDDAGVLRPRFGDDRNGARFPDGPAKAGYRIGNGVAGNVGREAISTVVFGQSDVDVIKLVRNPLPATGGTDPEPVAEVRERAPQEVRHRLLRAVTPADYAALAEQVPGVQRAAAELRWTGSWYEAQVAIDPVGTEVAADWLLDAERQALHRYRRIGHDLAVRSAALVPLDLELCVLVDPQHVTGHVRAALLKVFAELFRPDALTFGTPVRISRLVAAAAAVPGVRSAQVTRLHRLFGPVGDALVTGVLDLGPLEVAQLDNDPARPENGLLELKLGGGR